MNILPIMFYVLFNGHNLDKTFPRNTSFQSQNIYVFRFYKPVLVVNFKIMITKVLLVLWILIIMFYFVTCDGKGKKLQVVLSLKFFCR